MNGLIARPSDSMVCTTAPSLPAPLHKRVSPQRSPKSSSAPPDAVFPPTVLPLTDPIPPYIASAATSPSFLWRNWARIHAVHPTYYHQPTSVPSLQRVVAFAHSQRHHVRVAGAGHSPSDIALCTQHLVDLTHLNRILRIDSATRTCTVEAGVTLTDLLKALTAHGLTLPTTGSIGDQTIGGILGTGTHGTGTQCPIMSGSVIALTLLTADGRLLPCSPSSNADVFSAALVNLGCLGIVTEMTLQVVDAFQLTVEEEVRDFAHVITHLESIIDSTQYPRLHWCPHADKVVIHRMHEPDGTTAEERSVEAMRSSFLAFLFGSSVASVRPAVDRALRALNYFVMHGVYQVLLFLALYIHSLTPILNHLFHTWQHPWSTKATTAPAHEQFMFDCGISQHVTEWAIPRSHTVEALMSLHRLINQHHLQCDFPVEVRFVQGDDILLSPAHGRATCYINIISYRPYGRDHPMQHTFFHLFEEMMTGLGGRPHWAKPFNVRREGLRKMYGERLERFEQIRRDLDPEGMFVNPWLERVLDI